MEKPERVEGRQMKTLLVLPNNPELRHFRYFENLSMLYPYDIEVHRFPTEARKIFGDLVRVEIRAALYDSLEHPAPLLEASFSAKLEKMFGVKNTTLA